MASLNPAQLQWAQELSKNAAVAEKANKNMEKRQKAADAVALVLTTKLDVIKAGQMYELEQINTGLTGRVLDAVGHRKKLQSHDPGRDPNKEVDTGHYRMGEMEQLPPETVKRVMEAQKIIVDLTDQLRAATGEDGEALFTDIDIGNEIWANLVRQGVIPENAVPDQFSEVKRTFDAAAAAYQDRLGEYTDGLENNHSLLSKLGVADKVIENTAAMAKGVSKAVAAFVPMPLEEVTTVIELVQIAGTAAVGITKQAATTRDPAEIISSLGDLAAKTIAAGFIGQEGDHADALKIIIAGAVKSGVSTSKAGIRLAQGDTKGAFEAMADAVGSAISTSGTGSDKEDLLNDAGDYVVDSLKTASGLARATKLMAQGKKEEAAAALMESLVTVATVGLKKAGAKYYGDTNPDDLDDDELEKQIEDVQDELDEEMEDAGELLDAMNLVRTTDPEKLAKLLEDMEEGDKEKVEAAQEKLQDPAKQKAFDALITKRNRQAAMVAQARSDLQAKEFTQALANGDAGPGGEQATIERMILELKRQQKILELALKLSTMTFNVIGAFFPPVKIGASLIQLSAELAAAAKATYAFLEWRDNQGDAKAMVSVQAEAMANRAGLSSTQALRHGAEAALKTVQIIGQGLQLGGMTAHAGVAIEAGAVAASSAKAIIIEVMDQVEMETAWRSYRKAIENPADRLQARKALRSNATLAKYAIAYGALYENHPVAKNALRKCGLSEAALAEKASGINKVVQYMEMLYNEDPVVLRAVARPQDWHTKGGVVLTVTGWLTFVKAAQTKADPKLAPTMPVGGVSSAFALLTTSQAEYDKAKDENCMTVPVVEALLAQHSLLLRTLGGLRPLDDRGVQHKQFADYIDTMKALTEVRIMELEREVKLTPTAEEAVSDMFDQAA